MKNVARVSVVLVLVVLVAACSMTRKDLIIQQTAASDTLTELMAEYKLQRPMLSEERQVLIEAYFREANLALDAWESAISEGVDPTGSEEDFLEWKTKIVQELRRRVEDGSSS